MDITFATDLTYDDHIEIAKIEENYFKKDLIASPQATYSWYIKNNQTIIIAKDETTGSIAGHISFIPIKDNAFELLRKGVFLDIDISSDDIELCISPGRYKLYFCVICVSPKYQKKGVSRMLIREYAKNILALKEKGIIFSDIIADTITIEGKRFAKKALGMKIETDSKHGTQILHVDENTFYKKLESILNDEYYRTASYK